MKDNKQGFTLVEVMVYVAIIALMMTTLVLFSINLIQVRAKQRVIHNVEANAARIFERLADAARHAEGINTGASTFNSDPGTLSVNIVSAGVDPTIFSLTADDGVFQANEGGAGNVAITTDDVAITNLVFTNLTSVTDIGIIKVEFTVAAVNNSGNPLYSYEESFQTAIRIPLDN
jgi:prepilin-type N-terminal cleavage/methylation domain-containing protein